MKDKWLFGRFLGRTLPVFLLLWGVMMGTLVYNNYRWGQEDISRRVGGVQTGVRRMVQSVSQTQENNVALSEYAEELLERYGGQMVLRCYGGTGLDETAPGRSQLLVGFASRVTVREGGSKVVITGPDLLYLLFDGVLSDEEQLELAHNLREREDLMHFFAGEEQESWVEITGEKDGTFLIPQRIVFHLEEGEFTLLDLPSERMERPWLSATVQARYMEFSSALVGPGTPEGRLKTFRRLEGRLDAAEEVDKRLEAVRRQRGDEELEGEQYGVTMYPAGGGNTVRYWDSPSIAYSYEVDPRYPFFGLGLAGGLTLLTAAALAVFTAHIQAKSVRRERQFTRAAAHELKTPLAVLRTHAEALREEIAPEKRDEYLEIMLDESDRMAAQVDGLLDLSRLEAGVALGREEICLEEPVGAVLRRLEPAAQAKGVRLEEKLAPVWVSGDRTQLERMAEELCANALKYCSAGGAVRVSLVREGKQARLTVENDGAPIPAKALPHLWEPFYKADPARSREQGGAGLGLALVKAAAQAHGGWCSGENIPGGVRFTVSLPVLQSQG